MEEPKIVPTTAAAEGTLNVDVSEDERTDALSSGAVTPPKAGQKEDSPRKIHGIKWAIAYVSVLSSTFLFALDNTVVADIQPAILNQFGQVKDLPWMGVAFALGAIAILPWGRAYGVFDIKWLYIISVLLFEVGSALCGAAPNMNALIVGRVIGGVGGAGMYSGCLTYIAITTTNLERPMYMAGVAVVWGLGTVLGPVVGGAFTSSSATWRWAFYINLPIGAIFAPAYLFLLPSYDFRAGTSLMNKLKMMDWIAMAIFFAGTTCFTMAVNFGGTTYAWNSGSEIVLWVLSGVLLIVMAAVTIYHPLVSAENKLYPSHFLKRPVLVNLQVQLLLVSGVMLTTAYYIPLFFQFTQGDSALKAAVRLLPFIVMTVFFSIVNGALMPKFGYYMPWYVFGSAMVLIGSSLMYTVNINTSASKVYDYTTLMGIGAGTFLASSFAVVQALVPPEETSNAIGFMSIAQDLGIVVFLAMAGTMYQNIAIVKITPILVGAPASDVVEVIAEIIGAMSTVWALLIAGMALSLVLSFFLGRKRLYMEGGAPAA